jgi:holo-[acyl-carrier protein] synthase
MIFGTGTDIVSIERFQRFIDTGNTAILERLFTVQERAVCSGRKNSAACYAARFAAKESFLKALGTGLRDGICWLDMEVVSDDLGKPELLLSGEALKRYRQQGLGRLFLSLSHDGGCAVAMVVVEAS